MPDNEPNGTPAATDTAGQRPTTDGTSSQQSSDPASQQPAPAAQPSAADGQQSPQQQEPIRDPVAKAAADAEARYRTQLRDAQRKIAEFEAAQKAAEDAKLDDLQRAQKQAAEWQQKHADTTRAMQERIVGYEIQLQASRLNIIDPDAAVKLLDWTQLEYDEDGVPTNAAKVLADLAKAKPYLVAQSSAQSAQQAANPSAAMGSALPTDAQSAANAHLAAQLGATNPTRQNGPITVTANQYMDKAFAADFKNRYGMDLQSAVLRGKATII